eukprot:3683929-Pyramimonas_sp.AAC.1
MLQSVPERSESVPGHSEALYLHPTGGVQARGSQIMARSTCAAQGGGGARDALREEEEGMKSGETPAPGRDTPPKSSPPSWLGCQFLEPSWRHSLHSCVEDASNVRRFESTLSRT